MRFLEIAPTAGLPPRLADLLVWPRAGVLEAALEEMLGVPAQVECSGTACLVIALEALKQLSPRKTVIIPAFTCPLVVLAIAQAGLKALPCDLAQGGFEMSETHLSQLLSPDTLALVATHYAGQIADVARLRARARDAFIIEDAAQVFGVPGAGLQGDIGFFSFALGKGFTTCEGGALVARTGEMRARLAAAGARLRQKRTGRSLWIDLNFLCYHFLYNGLGLRLIYGLAKNFWLARGDEIAAIGDYFDEDIPVYAMSDWRKAVGASSLGRLKGHLAAAGAVRAKLEAALGGSAGSSLLPLREKVALLRRMRHGTKHSLNLNAKARFAVPSSGPSGPPSPAGGEGGALPLPATFLLHTFATHAQCASALKALWTAPLGVTKLFARCIGDYPYLAGKLEPSSTPNARDMAARTITISASPRLRDADIAEIASRIHLAVAET